MHLPHGPRLWVLPFFALATAFEIGWCVLAQRRAYPWRELFASAAVFVLRLPTKLLRPLVITPAAYLVWSHRLTTIPLRSAWGLALFFVAVELVYYWSHRLSHEVRWMWATHQAHHTPEQIHFASAYRLGATEVLSGGWLLHLPLYWLGFNPLAVSGALAVNLFYQFWLHTDLVGRLGPLELIFNTPSHHRVHHASNPEYLDRNYGGVLIIWDRLFGTFAEERPDIRIRYGLVHPVGSLNPLRLEFHEWVALARDTARAPSWRARLGAMFGRPGGQGPGVAGPGAQAAAAGATPAE